MSCLKFFDCNSSIGRRGIVNPGSFYKVEDLAVKMNYYGIEKALVYHSMSREYAPAVGNHMLLEEIKPYGFLEPVWTVMPHHTGEFPTPEELLNEMRQNNVRAVTMFPAVADHGYSLAEWNCSQLFCALEKHSIPLFIGFEQLTSWNELHDLLSYHIDLKVVLTNVNYRIDRNLYPLLGKFKNLFVETSGYKAHQGIEEICRIFGPERLIFGSGMPVFSGASAVTALNYARISQKEKEMITYENLNNLLGGVEL